MRRATRSACSGARTHDDDSGRHGWPPNARHRARNPILGDDGVGWRVVEAMRGRLDDEAVDVLCLSVGGVSLMEQLVGCDRALLVDAVVTGGTPGEVLSVPLDELGDPSCGHTASTHDTTLTTALSLRSGAPGAAAGRHLGGRRRGRPAPPARVQRGAVARGDRGRARGGAPRRGVACGRALGAPFQARSMSRLEGRSRSAPGRTEPMRVVRRHYQSVIIRQARR